MMLIRIPPRGAVGTVWTLGLLLAAASASASVSCDGGQSETLPLQGRIVVPPMAAPGTVLAPWTTAAYRVPFFCTWTGSGTVDVTLSLVSGLPATGLTVPHPDSSAIQVPVFATNVAGIGVAIATLGTYAFSPGGRQIEAPQAPGAGYLGRQSVSGSDVKVTIGARPRFAFVRLPGPVGAGPIDISGVVTHATTGGNGYTGTIRTHEVMIIGQTKFSTATCTVGSTQVDFGTVRASGQGPLHEVPFAVRLTGCPEADGIDYRVDPVRPPVDASIGMLSTAPGGASGLGVQVGRPNGATLVLGRAYPVRGYTGSAGDYDVNLRGVLHQLDPAVSPGRVEAEATLTVSYR